MRTLVIDASVAVKWLVPEEMSERAQELYGRDRQQAIRQFSAFSGYLIDLLEVDEMISVALTNACALRHPIYDLIYLETARRLDAQLITADRRFTAKLAETDLARHVTLLSDWQPE